jgi:hypothetical protein
MTGVLWQCTAPRYECMLPTFRIRNVCHFELQHAIPSVQAETIPVAQRYTYTRSKSKLNYDRQSVGQSLVMNKNNHHSQYICDFYYEINTTCFGSWCQAPIWDPRPIFLYLWNIFTQLRVCYFVAPSLTRGRVCNLLLLLALASTVPRDSRPYFVVPIIGTSPTWRSRSPYLYPPGTGWPRYTPGHWVPFPSPLTTRRATVEILYAWNRHPHYNISGYHSNELSSDNTLQER